MGVNDWELLVSIRPGQLQRKRLRQFRSGMVGIAPGQIARVNVVNTAAPGTLAKPVWVQGWSNPRSELLGEATFTLEPGVSAFLDLDRDAMAAGEERRLQVRATVTVQDDLDG